MLISNEEAKAIQEVAKTTEKAMELAKISGNFLRVVFGPLVEDAVGLVADRVKYYRIENLISYQKKVIETCATRGIDVITPLHPKIALPIIEAATIEESPNLQEMYVKLMVNALDPSYKDDIIPAFVSTLQDFTPFDTLFLTKLYTINHTNNWGYIDLRTLEWRNHLGIDSEADHALVHESNKKQGLYPITDKECLSVENLARLGCIRRAETGYVASAATSLFGRKLIEACTLK